MSDLVSPRKPRLGKVPVHRLANARRVRDKLRKSLLTSASVLLTIVEDGFGVQVYHDGVTFGDRVAIVSVDGVTVHLNPKPVQRPRR